MKTPVGTRLEPPSMKWLQVPVNTWLTIPVDLRGSDPSRIEMYVVRSDETGSESPYL